MIRIALTKGRIEQKAIELLKKAGYDCSELEEKGRKLVFKLGADDIEVVLAKAADVITYIEHGVCDVGIVGEDTIMEHGKWFHEILDLNFGKCKFALAGIKGKDFYQGYTHKIIASKYPNVTKKYFNNKGIDVEIVKIEGSVELAPILQLSDAIVDIVETGSTLRENGLEVYEDVAYVSTRLIVNTASIKLKKSEIDDFVKRISAQIEK
ncbi:MAG: ATP phosphoribosyltransferase [Clostridia bacterium]|nr:ATP phosphoribosyltransferase [Clostridia bacterium]